MLRRIAQAIASNPALYQLIQSVSGQRLTAKQLAVALAGADTRRALDVGSAGGGTSRGLLSGPVSIDVDVPSLAALKRANDEARAVAGSIAALPFRSGSFPTAICVAVSHHLDGPTLAAGLREIARVVSDRFVFIDAVKIDHRWMSRLLWRYDRGRFPRTRAELLAAVRERFVIESIVDYRFLHCYVVCVARPVSLRPVDEEDAARMLHWLQQPDVRRNLGVRREPSMEYTVQWIRRSQADAAVSARAIMVAGRHVGNVVLDQIDRATASARFSIYIGEATDRGHGIGRIAIALILEEAFGPLDLQRVWLTVAPENEAAIRAYRAAGFRQQEEGSMAITRDQWRP